MKISILYSGGLDSYIMYRMALIMHPEAHIRCIYYDHGQPVAKREIAGLPDFVEVRRIDWLDENKKPVAQPGRREGAIMIPGRNLVFGTLLACQELPDEIWIGALHGETHAKGTDKNWIFLEHLNRTINYVLGPFRYYQPITVRFPLAEKNLDKRSSVAWALENGCTIDELKSTRSCHSGETDRCGNCIQCFKRWCVFGSNGFSEEYDIHPLLSEFGRQFTFDLFNCEAGNDSYYEKDTRWELLPYLIKQYEISPELFEDRTKELINKIKIAV